MINDKAHMKYKLMIKTHNVTGLKYLCITKRKKWEQYLGSGTYWKNHIAIHGKSIYTELLFESDDYDEFVKKCIYYSDLLDVVRSKNFANQIPETGYDNIDGLCNFEIWWQHSTPEQRQHVISKRRIKQILNHWTKSDNSSEIRFKISIGQINFFNTLTYEERLLATEKARKKSLEFMNKKDTDEFKQYKELLRAKKKQYNESLTDEQRDMRANKISQTRLLLSDEGKQSRRDKIRNVYATGKHDALFKKMSEDRKGVNNPGAHIIVWEGTRYTTKDFREYIRKIGIGINNAFRIVDSGERLNCYRDYEVIKKIYSVVTCPHCGASSDANKMPSCFMRWHFDHCKLKGNDK